MSHLEEDINGAKRIIKTGYHSSKPFTKYSRIFPFTNENLISCFDSFDFKDKKCLTVLSSSDQALDMYLRGASRITTFDINVLTKYYFYLKKAALLSNLTKEEYIEFFYPSHNRDQIQYYKIFSKIAENLYDNDQIFWSKLFDGKGKTPCNLFSYDIHTRESLESSVKYLYGNNYYELMEKIRDIKISFINTDVKNLPAKISKKYDYIYLSNIMRYINYIYNKRLYASAEEYKKLILQLSNNLNENGNIIACYFYYQNTTWWNMIKEIFDTKNFSYNFHNNGIATLQYTKRTTVK